MNLEWLVAHELVTPEGSLLLNTPATELTSGSYALFLILPPYSIVPARLRPVSDSISQADGSSLQPPFIDGMVATLRVQFWVSPLGGDANAERAPACGQDLREMEERLTLHLNALRAWSADPDTDQRFIWAPTAYSDRRMLARILLAAWPAPAQFDQSGGIGTEVTFQLATPFPYAVDVTETVTEISDGGTAVITNAGNADYRPVMRAHGPSSAFVIANLDTGEAVATYAPPGPGDANPNFLNPPLDVGEFEELDFFTLEVKRNGTDSDIQCVDGTRTDFFPLRPGAQTIAAAGAQIVVRSRAAWA